jgi:hypothetical protein
MRSFIRASLKEKSFFFSESTMQFFGSQVHGEFHQISTDEPHRGYFITSEQDDEDGAWGGKRRYTIRYAQSPTEISDFSEFGQYATYEEAHMALPVGNSSHIGIVPA